MVGKKHPRENELLRNIREKYYNYNLNKVYDCQRLMIKIIKENNGNIITNRTYHLLDARVQEMINDLEYKKGDTREFRKYRRRQNKIEDYVSEMNKPKISKESKKRKVLINILLKDRYYEPKEYNLSNYDMELIK